MTELTAFRDTLPWAGTRSATVDATKVDDARFRDFYRIKGKLSTASAVESELLALAAENDRLSKVTLAKAVQFAIALPSDIAQPEVSVDPDGEVAFDWADNVNILSVSVGAAGRITYAGKLEAVSISDTLRFTERLPSSLGDVLKSFRTT
ncbi:hypothetical protein R69746_05752 [Paraburkholderia aspalathi]|uniref:hypothetical protein n=1 Tax=Paraburkholderia aspalathi TaxID=1324617 RepID=UPI00190D976F|nr:hypothetical protein [Paraburkholderia aspalathi]MBK3841886.1 hypothetical protein [Paraburkholderia aspalathi]CAE6814069.1 hypothetical protein R69746_05752 [Paraburkholderia aspalathi]